VGEQVRKGERTRAWIVARAAEVFNVRGVGGAAISDVMAATGLKKGGIYNHFGSKEELALASFDHAAALIERRFAAVWREEGIAALLAFVETFRGYVRQPPLPGGCPVLNTAIDSDDTDPALRRRAQAVAAGWHERLCRAVSQGQLRGDVRADVDGAALATVIIATLEGALMLTKLAGDLRHMDRAADHLVAHIERTVHA
jgi:TetR/AcrR family transcriptional repressor of nem operon